MIKKTITYTDYEGNSRTEDFYFNLTKFELLELNLSEEGGLDKMLKKIIDSQDVAKIVDVLKEVILLAYGEKSADGRFFVKNRGGQKLCEDFAQSPAFDELYFELAGDEKAAADFINGIIPKNLADEVAAQAALPGA